MTEDLAVGAVDPNKCTAKIEVNGHEVTCSLTNGPEHNPERGFAHEGKLDLGDKGMVVTWSYWRVVQPPPC
jgi:hypothetical protein